MHIHAHTLARATHMQVCAILKDAKGQAAQTMNWRDADARSPLHHAAEQGHAGVSHARVCVCEREQRGRDEVRWRLGAGSSYVYEA